MIELVDQTLKLPGLVAILDDIDSGLQRAFDCLQRQRERAGVWVDQWEATLTTQLAPDDKEQDIRPLFLHIDGAETTEAESLQAEVRRLRDEIKQVQQHTRQRRPELSLDLRTQIRGLCRSTQREPAPGNLQMFTMCGGERVEKRLYEWSQGMNADMTFESPMMLGTHHQINKCHAHIHTLSNCACVHVSMYVQAFCICFAYVAMQRCFATLGCWHGRLASDSPLLST